MEKAAVKIEHGRDCSGRHTGERQLRRPYFMNITSAVIANGQMPRTIMPTVISRSRHMGMLRRAGALCRLSVTGRRQGRTVIEHNIASATSFLNQTGPLPKSNYRPQKSSILRLRQADCRLAGHAGGATLAGVGTISPRPVGMLFANPAAVLALQALASP
jgi:hypothetical protein